MKVFLTVLILGGVLGWFYGPILPWWTFSALALLAALLLAPKGWGAFWGGLLAGVFLWVGFTLWFESQAALDFSGQMAEILTLSPTLLLVATGIVGGSTVGLSALSGALLRRAAFPPEAKR